MGLHLGLIGHPISHSLSPWIHNQLLKESLLDGDYRLIDFHSTDLSKEHITQLKNMNLHGFNVTVPYKEKIIPFLDDLDNEAKIMEAVNTVVVKQGKWIGYNTDGRGYLRSLNESYPEIMNDKTISILIIGAGGAAKGIYHSLVASGFINIDIANRTPKNAEQIALLKNNKTKTSCYAINEAEMLIENYSIIIQTTSVGMKPKEDGIIMNVDNIKPNTIVSDIVYQPLMTTFLKQAKKKGALLHPGHTMLLYQAQYAFEIWSGYNVNTSRIKARLQRKLEGNGNANR